MFGQLWQELWTAALIVLVVAGMLSGQSVLVAFGAMGLAMTAASWVWGRVSLQGVTYERILPRRRLFIGEEAPISIVVTNRKPVPLAWVTAHDGIPDAATLKGANVRRSVDPNSSVLEHSASIGLYERVRWDYTVRFGRRGYFRLGPARIESGDMFGLFDSRRRLDDAVAVLVYPRVLSLPDLGIDDGRPIGDSAGGPAIFADPSRPEGMREYRPGDGTGSIDWKTTARRGRLSVRTFGPSISSTVIVAVSVETSAQYWRGYSPDLTERAVTAAASLSAHFFSQGRSLGLISNGLTLASDRPAELSPSRSPSQLPAVLETLATLDSMPAGAMSAQLAARSQTLPPGTSVAVVTAYCDPNLLGALTDVGSRGHPTALIYVGDDPPPQVPPGIDLRSIGAQIKRAMREEAA